MMPDLLATLDGLFAGRELRVGQVTVRRLAEGFELFPAGEPPAAEELPYTRPSEARQVAQYDSAGQYRPLKTAPNLRRDWRLRVRTLAELREALDYLYPAMLGLWRDDAAGRLEPVPLRDTLGRQTGMYAVTRKLTDEQAQELIGGFCQSATGCLKRILWPIAPGLPIRSLPPEKFDASQTPGELPLLCPEACNLLVAKARETVKVRMTS